MKNSGFSPFLRPICGLFLLSVTTFQIQAAPVKKLAKPTAKPLVKPAAKPPTAPLQMVLQNTPGAYACALSPDNRWFVSAINSQNPNLVVYDLKAGRHLKPQQIGGNRFNWLEFSPDGKTLLLSQDGGALIARDFQSGRELWRIGEDKRASENFVAESPRFSPDGKTIAIAANLDGKAMFDVPDNFTVRLLDAQTGKTIWDGKGHMERINTVRFAAGGAKIVSGSQDETLRVWDAVTGRELLETPKSKETQQKYGPVSNIEVLPDGKRALVATKYDQSLHVVDLQSGARGQKIGDFKESISVLSLSPDGTQVFAAGYGNEAGLWDTRSGKLLKLLAPMNTTDRALWTRDGRLVGDVSGGFGTLDTKSGQARVLTPPAREEKVILRPDGREWLVVDGESLRAFNATTLKATRVYRSDEKEAYFDKAQFSRDAKWLVASLGGARFGVWNAQTGAQVAKFSPPDTENAPGDTDFTLMPGGKTAFSAANNARYVWEIASGKLLQSYTQKDLKQSLPSPDGTKIYSNSDEGAFVLSWPDKKQISEPDEPPGDYNTIAWSPNGQSFAAKSGDKFRVWDAATGKIIREWKMNAYPRSFDERGETIEVSNGENEETLQVLDVASGKVLDTITSNFVYDGFFPDKERAYVRTDDGVEIVDVASKRAIFTLDLRADGDWLAFTPAGQYDGTPQGIRQISYARGLESYDGRQFAERFYRPGLLRTLAGKIPTFQAPVVLAQAAPPIVRILSPQNGAANGGKIEVAVEAREQNGGGIKAIRLYHNGRLVGGPGSLRGIVVEAVPVSNPNTENYVKRFPVELVPGENVLRAVAYSKTEVESVPGEVRLNWNTPLSRPTLHVLCVGVNTYADASMNLTYARPDAQSLADFFKNEQKLFAKANIVTLLDAEATGAKIRVALDQIAKTSAPQDVVFLYFAGHGEVAPATANSKEETFFFLPADARQMILKERVREFGLAGREIDARISKIAARKIVLVYDACKSGAAITGATRGVEEERLALAQLARAQGIHILAASTAQQYAGEVRALGHGILTYALLEGLNGKAANAQGTVDVLSLMSYVEDRVPVLTKQYRDAEQYPVPMGRGQNFPLVLK